MEEITMIAPRSLFIRRTVGSLGAVMLLVAATAASVSAGDQRPMKGRYTIAVVPVEQRCGPNALTIGFEGVGIATHLGRMEGTGSNCTSFNLTTEAVLIWDGLATFVAADGSSITMSYEGTQDAPVNGRATAANTFTVISGTGRFDGATGSWTSAEAIDFTTGIDRGSFSGWISY
ncbi:MAG TPA: hypothetical protein VMP67_02370 [Candidatus Limnocylindria bacterium]|nr:hypothetical protein [Candidatus Limnocylindria bacterium]